MRVPVRSDFDRSALPRSQPRTWLPGSFAPQKSRSTRLQSRNSARSHTVIRKVAASALQSIKATSVNRLRGLYARQAATSQLNALETAVLEKCSREIGIDDQTVHERGSDQLTTGKDRFFYEALPQHNEVELRADEVAADSRPGDVSLIRERHIVSDDVVVEARKSPLGCLAAHR